MPHPMALPVTGSSCYPTLQEQQAQHVQQMHQPSVGPGAGAAAAGPMVAGGVLRGELRSLQMLLAAVEEAAEMVVATAATTGTGSLGGLCQEAAAGQGVLGLNRP